MSSGWGSERRRAAITVSFETLADETALTASQAAAPTVSPALPTLLQLLAERDLSATFFVDAATAEAEPLALTMIAAGRHEIAALTAGPDDLQGTIAALTRPEGLPRGVRPRPRTILPDAAALTEAGVRYVSAPESPTGASDAVEHLALDRRLSDAAYLAPDLVGLDEMPGGGPPAWHQAAQLAIGRAVEHGTHVTLTIFPGLLERRDALGVLAEILDLIAGLVRAGRVWVPTLGELAAPLKPDAERRAPVADFAFHFTPGRSDWTLLLLHGTGGDERQLLPVGEQLAPDAASLGVRGQVLEHGQLARYFARDDRGAPDLADLAVRADELAAFVSRAVAEHDRDPTRIVAVGFSNGANIAVGLLLRHPRLLRTAVLLRPAVSYAPHAREDLHGTEVFIAAGADDPYAPPPVTGRLQEALETAGATVRTATQPAGHELTAADVEAAREWLAPRLANPAERPRT